MSIKNATSFFLLLLAVFCMSCSYADSDDHLAPSADYRIGTESNDVHLQYLFADAFHDDVILQVLARSSFSPEAVFGIRRLKNGDEVFALESKKQISLFQRLEGYESQKRGGPQVYFMNEESYQSLLQEIGNDYRKVEVVKAVAAIPGPITDRILVVWQTALSEVRPMERPALQIDGGTLTFSVPKNPSGALVGIVWSPSKETKMYRLWVLASSLRQFAEGSSTIVELEQALVSSEADFKKF